MDNPETLRIAIERYRCLLRGTLDAHMRRVLGEMLDEEETKLAACDKRAEHAPNA